MIAISVLPGARKTTAMADSARAMSIVAMSVPVVLLICTPNR